MKRKDFLKGAAALGALSLVGNKANSTTQQKQTIMKTIVHKADTRGKADHGWLNSRHTFSFGGYRNPDRTNFGVLRVLNDDKVAPGKGFGKHPHDNMEIISIPLSGDLEHQDSIGNIAVIKEGDVQVMSAGTGIFHSEYNKNDDQNVEFLQIWVIPNKRNVNPRYDQISLSDIDQPNEFVQTLSPNQNDQGVWIHQDAYFSLGRFNEQKSTNYQLKNSKNGVYAFLIEGNAKIGDQQLNKRDGMGIWDTTDFNIETEPGTKLLLMEVPLTI